jgi:hypothetical protein
MSMILPERTVDAWTATYITGRRWRARLWAPTERAPGEHYDLGAGLGTVGGMPGHVDPEPWPDKVFVLEHKGVDEHRRTKNPVIWIRVRQLLEHLFADRARGGRLVYYLLPDVEWPVPQNAPYGTVPTVAVRRTRGVTWDGFQLWAYVAHVEDLLAMLALVYVADPSRFTYRAAGGSRADDWICGLGTTELPAIPNVRPLRDFISSVHDCTNGRAVTDPSITAPPPPGAPGPPDLLGPSLDGLGTALEVTEPHRGGPGGDEPTPDSANADEAALDAIDRPAFVTFYGVGDSDKRPSETWEAPDEERLRSRPSEAQQ